MKNVTYPIIVEKDEDGFYAAECPLFEGCYAQGKTYEEAIDNVKKVIQLCKAEQKSTLFANVENVSLTAVTV